MLDNLIKPNKLTPGDKVAVVSLSWGGPGTFPYRFEVGKQRLESIFGLEVVPSKHALKEASWIDRNPKARADDLMDAFLDPNIKGIISSIGGDDSIRLLPLVDLEVIRQNPKIFMGYSDSTVTHFQCLKAGLGTFYGPAVMVSFAENMAMHDYTIAGVKKTLFSNEVIGNIPQNTEGWTTERLEWGVSSNSSIQRKLQPAVGWSFIGNEQPCQGRLIGGCLEALQFIKGTDLWPEPSVWKGNILFIETSEEGVEPIAVLRFLRNLAAQGILASLSGIMFSKPGGHLMTAERFQEYDSVILKAFEEYGLPLIPIVTRMDFGHSDPMWVLPYGSMVEINPVSGSVKILESGTL